MSLALKTGILEGEPNERVSRVLDLTPFVPLEVLPLDNTQTDLPRIAKDERLIRLIEEAVRQIPTMHTLNLGDARNMSELEAESLHLVVTSPPYWTLKEYRRQGMVPLLSDSGAGRPADLRCWRRVPVSAKK